jgi:hypothetical protein
MVATLGREAPRGGDERSDAGVGHAIDDVPPLPASRHKPAPLQTGEMVGNAAARRADDRGEFHDRTFPFEQDLQHAQPCGVAEHAKVPRSGGPSWARRTLNAALRCRSHVLLITGFPVIVKRARRWSGGRSTRAGGSDIKIVEATGSPGCLGDRLPGPTSFRVPYVADRPHRPGESSGPIDAVPAAYLSILEIFASCRLRLNISPF